MKRFDKRDYVLSSKCPEMAWLNRHREGFSYTDEEDYHLYDELNRLGAEYYGGGAAIEFEGSIEDAFKRTMIEVNKGSFLISTPYFVTEDMSCRPSMLRKNGDNYDLIQVVDTSSVKDDAILGTTFMTYVAEKCGVEIEKVKILHINTSYVRGKNLDVKSLFSEVDVTEKVRGGMVNMESYISVYKDTLKSEEEPLIGISEVCDKSKCPYVSYCRDRCGIPNNSVFDISGRFLRPSKKYKLYNQGIVSFEDIVTNEKTAKLSENAMKQVLAEYEDKDYINMDGLKEFSSLVHNPIYYLDFESFTQVIPLYEGIRPYQQVCFQYSLHIEQADGTIEHREYLAHEGCNPMEDFIKHLCNDVPADVTVMVYNKDFEITRMREMAEAFPEYADHLLSICNNVVDLMVPFMHKDYYVKEMKGSYSIKYVLPALFPNDPELDYHRLEEIHKGDEASAAFCNLINKTEEERQVTRRNLLKYCELDTLAMVKIYHKIKSIICKKAA